MCLCSIHSKAGLGRTSPFTVLAATHCFMFSALQGGVGSDRLPDWLLHHEALALDSSGDHRLAPHLQVSSSEIFFRLHSTLFFGRLPVCRTSRILNLIAASASFIRLFYVQTSFINNVLQDYLHKSVWRSRRFDSNFT